MKRADQDIEVFALLFVGLFLPLQEEMIQEMVAHDLDDARKDILCEGSGYRVASFRE